MTWLKHKGKMTDPNRAALEALHQSQLKPEDNKFHKGNGSDGKHYWITPPELYEKLNAQYNFDFDPCPFPKPDDFDGLTCEWGKSSYVNPPFGSIIHNGKKKGATAWARKAIEEHKKGKRVVLVHPMDKWVLMMIAAGAKITNLGDVKWLATEDGSAGKGTGRHIACFVLDHPALTQAAKPVEEKCVTCQATGKVKYGHNMGEVFYKSCPECDGNGYIIRALERMRDDF